MKKSEAMFWIVLTVVIGINVASGDWCPKEKVDPKFCPTGIPFTQCLQLNPCNSIIPGTAQTNHASRNFFGNFECVGTPPLDPSFTLCLEDGDTSRCIRFRGCIWDPGSNSCVSDPANSVTFHAITFETLPCLI
jgi:hypothetical protein